MITRISNLLDGSWAWSVTLGDFHDEGVGNSFLNARRQQVAAMAVALGSTQASQTPEQEANNG